MRNKLLLLGAVFAAAMLFSSCGGSGSSGASGGTEEAGGGGGSGGGTATVATLASIPSVDLSNYDQSAQAASADIAALPNKSLSASVLKAESPDLEGRRLGDSFGDVGSPSRAGCEANMHKKEAIRLSQEAQLDRCYMEAMEKGGLITIPTGSYNYYKIVMPAPREDELQRKCGNIPDQDDKTACLSGEGAQSGNVIARIGRFGDNSNELRIDMCIGKAGEELKENEATYTASGSIYTGTVIRKGKWNGKVESGKFAITVDAAAVVDGVVDLGTSGSATAEGWMNGSFGGGHILFHADPSDLSNTVQGAFHNDGEDPFSGFRNDFTMKAYAKFGGLSNTGTAKFSFSGSHPAMSLEEMLNPSDSRQGPQQQGIPAEQLANFYQFMSQQLGVTITANNVSTIKVCPTPEGMTIASGDTCSDGKDGIESFSIANVLKQGDAYSAVEQSFAIILHSASAFYNDVKDVDISGFSADPGAIEFTRSDWNCEAPANGWTLEIYPDQMMAGNLPVGVTVDGERLRAAMENCDALDEKVRENMGMGGYDCNEREMRGDVGDKFGGGEEAGHSGDEGGMIPAPCTRDRLSPDDCATYCEAHQGECFSDSGGEPPAPPPPGEKPQYCQTNELDFEECGQYCQAHPTDCGFR